MRIMSNNVILKSALLLGLVTSGANAVRAEDDVELEKLKQEKALIVAEKELLAAQAELRAAKFAALGIPQFENKTTVGAKGGEIEAAMLASWAVREAAKTIAGVSSVKSRFVVTPATASTEETCSPSSLPGRNMRSVVLVMAANDAVDFGLPQTVSLQLEVIEEAYKRALTVADSIDAASPEIALAGISTSIMALKTAAGLFGQETTVTGVELASIDDAMLVNAVAGRLPGCALIVSKSMGTPDFGKSEIYRRLQAAMKDREKGQMLVSKYPEKPTDAQKSVIALFKEADALLAAFHKAVTTASDKGVVPLSQAIVLEKVDLTNSIILRVSANAKGGSLVNSKNIATTFGVDPVKVSGGLVASYSVTLPGNGLISQAGVVTCQTSLASLRKIQTRRWNAIEGSVKSGTAAPQKLAICHL